MVNLKAIPLNGMDQILLSAKKRWLAVMIAADRLPEDGVEHTVCMGVDNEEVLSFKARTFGPEEYLLFEVFVAKIRRESEGLQHQSVAIKRAWYEMATAFVDTFGEPRTPPDILALKQDVKDDLN